MHRFVLATLLLGTACSQTPSPSTPQPPAQQSAEPPVMFGLVVEALPQGPSPDEPGGVYPIVSLPDDPALSEIAPPAAAGDAETKAEVAFLAAEQKREAAKAIAMPEYAGSGTADDVKAFVAGPLAEWLPKERAAIDEAERAYIAVLEVEPSPPARWVVAAGLRVGALWVGFAHDVRAKTPVPADWQKDGFVPDTDPPLAWKELGTTYRASVDHKTQPFLNRGRTALDACARHARRHGVNDAFGNGCIAWVAKNPLPPRPEPVRPSPPPP